MACPFAPFSRLSGFGGEKASLISSIIESTSPTSTHKLTTRLKDGTWEAHQEIEKSVGVRALMGSFHASSTVPLSRVDHFRFLIMLACVYVTMECILVQDKNALSDMTFLLTRSNALLDDIQVHLDEILDTTEGNPSEMEMEVEDGAEVDQRKIFAKVFAAQKVVESHGLLNAPYLTADHIALLTQRQAKATLRYINNLSSLKTGPRPAHYDEGISFTPIGTPASSQFSSSSSPLFDLSSSTISSQNGLFLAHAYVRYMGDLSGGQHIVKRLSKLFPIYESTKGEDAKGFSFYSFTSTGKSSSELKDMIRSRMDGATFEEKDILKIVDEASEAFRLNRGLLDSLVDEESSEESSEVATGNSSTLSHPSSLPLSMIIFHPHTLAFIATLLALGSAITFLTLAE